MAEYNEHHAAIQAAGADVVALAVDPPNRSAAVRTQLGLQFPILCDTARVVARDWDLYNAKEMGGIAVPAVFIIGADRRVKYRSIDTTSLRVSIEGVLPFLQGQRNKTLLERRAVRPGVRNLARAIVNVILRGMRAP